MSDSMLGKTVLSETAIKSGVTDVAQRLNKSYREAVILTVVPGGILFTVDLVRQLEFNVLMDYISCPHIPGEKNNNSDIVFHNNVSISGKDIIIVDDAIESGGTMKRLVQHIIDGFMPKSLAVATLFVKPGRIDIPAKQYYGYELENDDLLIGYGLPWEHKYRNLPEVFRLNI